MIDGGTGDDIVRDYDGADSKSMAGPGTTALSVGQPTSVQRFRAVSETT
ncbi:MAG: hypothetical protein Q7J57_09630 [Gemmobacter sp.]|nr:hypothetical protein [Gemmobacter sp.]